MVDVSADGRIEVRGIESGTYQLTVRTSDGRILTTELISVSSGSGRQVVRIRPPQQEVQRPVSGTVSAKRLAHKIPNEVRKLYGKALKASEKREYEVALDYLRKATEIDPEYMEVHNNMGTAYMQMDRTEEALAAFRRAIELDPGSSRVQVNIAVALMAKKAYAEAEVAARRAVDLNAGDMKARYILGLALYSQRKYTPEAMNQLRRVEDNFPNARIAVAAMQATLGELDLARETLRGYIASGAPDRRRDAEAMLAQLKK